MDTPIAYTTVNPKGCTLARLGEEVPDVGHGGGEVGPCNTDEGYQDSEGAIGGRWVLDGKA